MLIGKSSDLYKDLYQEELLISEPFVEYEFGEDYAHVAISGVSKDPDKILEKLLEQINKMKKEGIKEENFNRIRNMLYGNAVKEFNSVSDIARMFVTDYFKGINSFDYLETYKQITMEYAKQVLEDTFKDENTVISIIKGK